MVRPMDLFEFRGQRASDCISFVDITSLEPLFRVTYVVTCVWKLCGLKLYYFMPHMQVRDNSTPHELPNSFDVAGLWKLPNLFLQRLLCFTPKNQS